MNLILKVNPSNDIFMFIYIYIHILQIKLFFYEIYKILFLSLNTCSSSVFPISA